MKTKEQIEKLINEAKADREALVKKLPTNFPDEELLKVLTYSIAVNEVILSTLEAILND